LSERECIVCASGGPFPGLYERDGFRLVRCPACSLVFQHPQPSDEVLAGAYYHDEEFARRLFGDLRRVTLDNAGRRLRHLRGSGALRPGMRVLDVGTASGAWLEVAAREGMTATGIEIGAETARLAREGGLDVRTGTLGDVLPELEGERFDLITFWDVLEHLRDPREELTQARGLLREGGRLAATFPNVEGLYPRLTYRLMASRNGIWEYPELPVHLYDFSPVTATRLLEGSGFAVERIGTFGTPFRAYRETTLSRRRTGTGARAALVRAAFEGLHLVAYPVAALVDRGNSMFVLARLPDSRP
jgi:SAM-dependent methyltransferase